jgi:hypothetical protein
VQEAYKAVPNENSPSPSPSLSHVDTPPVTLDHPCVTLYHSLSLSITLYHSLSLSITLYLSLSLSQSTLPLPLPLSLVFLSSPSAPRPRHSLSHKTARYEVSFVISSLYLARSRSGWLPVAQGIRSPISPSLNQSWLGV